MKWNFIFDSHSSNEAFARVTVAAFMTQLNPTVEEVSDVKTAVSEAVTNAIIHGYEEHTPRKYISGPGSRGRACFWKWLTRAWGSRM